MLFYSLTPFSVQEGQTEQLGHMNFFWVSCSRTLERDRCSPTSVSVIVRHANVTAPAKKKRGEKKKTFILVLKKINI